MATLCAALLLTGLAVLGFQQGHFFAVPFGQWLFAIPAVCLGVVFVLLRKNTTLQVGALVGFVGFAFLAGWSSGVLQIAIAGTAFLLCNVFPVPSTRTSDWASSLALGVYLSHPIMLSVLERTTTFRQGSVQITLGAFLCALLLASVLHVLVQHRKPVTPIKVA